MKTGTPMSSKNSGGLDHKASWRLRGRLQSSNHRFFDPHLDLYRRVWSELDPLQRDRLRAREVVDLRAQLAALQNSTFWKLTAPFRNIVERLKRSGSRPETGATHVTAAPPYLPPTYDEWITMEEPAFLAALAQEIPGQKRKLTISLGIIFLSSPGTSDNLMSLMQTCPCYCNFFVFGEDDPPDWLPANVTFMTSRDGLHRPDALRDAIETVDADVVYIHDGRNQLAPEALALVARRFGSDAYLDIVFADEDWLDEKGARHEPFFKPGWNTEFQRGCDLIGPFVFFRKEMAHGLVISDKSAWRYEFINRLIARTTDRGICHIPAVLCHRHPAGRLAAADMIAAIAPVLIEEGFEVAVTPVPTTADSQRVTYSLPTPAPLLSAIVCTRDRASLLQTCIKGLLEETHYPELEIIIVDNGTTEPEALDLLNRFSLDDRVKVLRCPGPFNWSVLNNVGAAAARGDIFLFLNNDVRVLHVDWLTELVAQVRQPGVGAVGPKLLYPDGRVQHAGLTTDQFGIPRHLFRYAASDDPGSNNLMAIARDVWALTGACIAVAKDVFWSVGGMNEALAVSCNDVDLCIRLTAHGYRILWTPWSILEHREFATRPSDQLKENQARAREEINHMIREWGSLAVVDPYWNINQEVIDDLPALKRFPDSRD